MRTFAIRISGGFASFVGGTVVAVAVATEATLFTLRNAVNVAAVIGGEAVPAIA